MNESLLNRILEALQELLARFGVAEASRPMGALVALYLVVTLLVLFFVLLVWKLSKDKKPSQEVAPPAEQEDVQVESAEEEPPVPVEVAEAETPPPTEPEPVAVEEAPAVTGVSVLSRMRSGLGKTRDSLVGRLDNLFQGKAGFSQELIDELEEILITSDFGMATTMTLIDSLQTRFGGTSAAANEVYAALKEEIATLLRQAGSDEVVEPDTTPQVVMMVGVNGVGKTTTIGKLASRAKSEGKSVLLGAGDTFRAAAADQLEVWSERAGVDIVRHKEGGDPAAVAFDAVKAAVARKVDLLLLDTAGRLHTKANLMEELKKVRRVLARELDGAPHQTLLVVDATTGQNALAQARLFKEVVEVDGIVLTKLDGTAKGGIVAAISSDLQIPLVYFRIGEQIDDLRPFNPDLFVEALFGDGNDA